MLIVQAVDMFVIDVAAGAPVRASWILSSLSPIEETCRTSFWNVIQMATIIPMSPNEVVSVGSFDKRVCRYIAILFLLTSPTV